MPVWLLLEGIELAAKEGGTIAYEILEARLSRSNAKRLL